jgi:transposase-like protein
MDCPDCGEVVEHGESGYSTRSPKTNRLAGIQIEYVCTDCGREWTWTQGVPGLIARSDMSGAPEPAWRETP